VKTFIIVYANIADADQKLFDAYSVVGPFEDSVGPWLDALLHRADGRVMAMVEKLPASDLPELLEFLPAVHHPVGDQLAIINETVTRAELAAIQGVRPVRTDDSAAIGC